MKTFLKSLGYAASGIVAILKTERHSKFHLAATVAVIALSIVVGLDNRDWLWIILAIALVWIAEMANTAIEKLCDKVSPEKSPEIKFVKDVSAGFVLIASFLALIIGLIIFYPYAV